MIRKAIKQGPVTIMVSLPSNWVKRYNIKRGDAIHLKENENSLILSTEAKIIKKKEVVLKINDIKDFTPRMLTTPYLQGHDTIEIHFNNSKVFHEIEKEISYLLGFEIIKKTTHFCIIKNIAQGIESNFDNLLQRMMNILISMGTETLNHINNNNYENILLLKSAELESNKISLLCRRMLNSNLVNTKKNNFSIYTMVTLMEAVADEYRFIIEYLNNNKPKIAKETKEFFNQVNNIVKTFNKLFTKFDLQIFINFREERQSVQRNFHQFEKLQKTDIYITQKLFNIIELIHHSTYF